MHMHTLSMWRLIKSGASDQMHMHTLHNAIRTYIGRLIKSDRKSGVRLTKWKCVCGTSNRVARLTQSQSEGAWRLIKAENKVRTRLIKARVAS